MVIITGDTLDTTPPKTAHPVIFVLNARVLSKGRPFFRAIR